MKQLGSWEFLLYCLSRYKKGSIISSEKIYLRCTANFYHIHTIQGYFGALKRKGYLKKADHGYKKMKDIPKTIKLRNGQCLK